MSVGFTVAARINRPVADVYESVVSPGRLSKYFTTDGAKGRIEAGATVLWQFPEEPGEYPVDVIEAEAPSRIVLQWDAPEGTSDGRTTATMTFEPLDDDRTLVTIAESGWRDDETRSHCFLWQLRRLDTDVVLPQGLGRIRRRAAQRVLPVARSAVGRDHHRRFDLAALDPLVNGDDGATRIEQHPRPLSGQHVLGHSLTVAHSGDGLVVKCQRRVVCKTSGQRDNRRSLDLRRVGLVVATNRSAAQRTQVRSPTKCGPDVGSDRTDVGTRSAAGGEPEHLVSVMFLGCTGDECRVDRNAVDGYRARLAVRPSCLREPVRATACRRP